eukprot:SAG11_NODE_6506_length_1300_cov_1.746878_1_plen_65_part_10
MLHLLLLQKPLDWFLQPKFNLGFHNLSMIDFTPDELQVLGLGDKFIPTSWQPSKELLDKQLRQFS